MHAAHWYTTKNNRATSCGKIWCTDTSVLYLAALRLSPQVCLCMPSRSSGDSKSGPPGGRTGSGGRVGASSSSGGADEGQWSIRATGGAMAPRLASATPTSVSGQVSSQATLMYWLLCIMETAYTAGPCHAVCHEVAQVLSVCCPSTMHLDRSMHSFEVLHLMCWMDSQSLHEWSFGNQQSSNRAAKGVPCSQGSGDKFSRPYRTSPDQLVSVGRSAGLAGGKAAAADKPTSSTGASSSGATANGKAVGLTSNLNAASGGKLSTSSIPRR